MISSTNFFLASVKKITVLFLPVIIIVTGFTSNSLFAQETLHVIQLETPEDLHDFFQYTGNDIPLVSGHRGGIVEGYPENSIAAMENTLRYTHAYFELDPRVTKDSVIVLMHDEKLDRTTTGTGNVSDYTWKELQELFLVDHLGNVTDYKIPSLAEAIKWSRGKTIINLDKKDVPLEMTAAIIREHQAEAHVMLTVHSAEEARFYLDQNPGSMFSTFIRDMEEFQEYEREKIPWGQVVAYVGPRYNPEKQPLYNLLHEHGVMIMVGAAPTYDKLGSVTERKEAYQNLIENGMNIIESDLPVDAGSAAESYREKHSPKKNYFKTLRQE